MNVQQVIDQLIAIQNLCGNIPVFFSEDRGSSFMSPLKDIHFGNAENFITDELCSLPDGIENDTRIVYIGN
jgi:hypothetical protein